MPPRAPGWILVLLSACWSTAGAAHRCKLVMSPPVPIRMENLRSVISADINGTAAQFMVDTGSFWDFLSPAAAQAGARTLPPRKSSNPPLPGTTRRWG